MSGFCILTCWLDRGSQFVSFMTVGRIIKDIQHVFVFRIGRVKANIFQPLVEFLESLKTCVPFYFSKKKKYNI